MATVTRQIDNEEPTIQSEGPAEVTQRAWQRAIQRMKRQGWRETRRFFDGPTATVFLQEAEGSVAKLILSNR